MKICIVTNYHEEATSYLYKHLAEQHDVSIIYLVNSGNKKTHIFDLSIVPEGHYGLVDPVLAKAVLETYTSYLTNTGKVRFYVFSNKGYSSGINYKLFSKLSRIIKQERYDLVHIIGQNPFLMVLHFGLGNTPIVQTLHESYAHLGKTHWSTRLFMRYLKSGNVKMIFHSENTRNRFYRGNIKRYHESVVIPLGFHEILGVFRKNSLPTLKKTILFLGYVKPYKGVEYLVDAFNQVRERIADAHLMIAGKWSMPELYESIKDRKDITIINKVVDVEDMVDLVQKCYFIVCPYVTASQSGAPLTAFEFDKPIITTDVEGLSDMVENGVNGFVVKKENAAALADAIEELLINENLYQEFISNINKFRINSGSYTESVINKTVSVYRNAMGISSLDHD